MKPKNATNRDQSSCCSKLLNIAKIILAPIVLPIVAVFDLILSSMWSVFQFLFLLGFFVVTFTFAFFVRIYRCCMQSNHCVLIELVLNDKPYMLLSPPTFNGPGNVWEFSMAFDIPRGFILLPIAWTRIWWIYKPRVVHNLF